MALIDKGNFGHHQIQSKLSLVLNVMIIEYVRCLVFAQTFSFSVGGS